MGLDGAARRQPLLQGNRNAQRAHTGEDWGKLGGYGSQPQQPQSSPAGAAPESAPHRLPPQLPTVRVPQHGAEARGGAYVLPHCLSEPPPAAAALQAPQAAREAQRAELQQQQDAVLQQLEAVPTLARGTGGSAREYLTNVLPIIFREGAVYHQYAIKSIKGDRERGGAFHSKSLARGLAALRAVLSDAPNLQQQPYKDAFAFIVHPSGSSILTNMPFPYREVTLTRAPRPSDTSPLFCQKLSVGLEWSREIATDEVSQDLISIVSDVLRESLRGSGMQRIGRTYFDLARGEDMGVGLGREVVPGLYFALHPTRIGSGVALTADVIHKVVHTNDAWTEARADPAVGAEPDFRLPATQAHLKRSWEGRLALTVWTDPRTKTRSTVTIDQVLFMENETTPQASLQGGSLADYFLQHHGLVVPHNQPVLVHVNRSKRDPSGGPLHEKYLPSVLRLTGLPPAADPRGEFIRDRVARIASLTPGERFEKIKSLLIPAMGDGTVWKQLAEQKWGFCLQKGFSIITGRRLEVPELEMAGGAPGPSTDRGIWPLSSWTGPAFANVPNPPVGVHFLCPEHAMQTAAAALPELQSALNHYAAAPIQISVTPIPSFSQTGVAAIAQAMALHSPACDAFLVCADQTCGVAYSCAKRESIIRAGKPSQVVREHTLADTKNRTATMGHLAQQLLCKLGNEPWRIRGCYYPETMVVGIAFHQATAPGAASAVGVAATVNATLSRYALAECPTGHSGAAATAFRHCLGQYVRVNGGPPTQIVVFREGGEGEIAPIMLEEIRAIEEAVAAEIRDTAAGPQLAYFLVVREAHVRLCNFQEGDGALQNAEFGACVDCLANQRGLEFLLLSQPAEFGCASAVKYKALRNTLPPAWTADRLQQLACRMSCMYYNWNGAVQVPACCLYAARHARMFANQLSDQGMLYQISPNSRIRKGLCIPCL